MPNLKKFPQPQEVFLTRNDLPAATRKKMIALLDQHLADSADLYSQVKHAHWNVKGPNFIALHKLFDKLAETVAEQADRIAERATAFGGVVHGTTRMAAGASRLDEYPAGAFAGELAVAALADRFAALALFTRKAIDASEKAEDLTTSDLFTQVSHDLDKALWFLESHLENGR